MLNIIALISILMSPVSYPQYNLVSETPDVVIQAQQASYNNGDVAPSVMMPEIVVTAPRPLDNIEFPEIVVAAPRYMNQDVKPFNNMMPEVVITAERYSKSTGSYIFSQISPNNNENKLGDSNSYGRFDIYALILIALSFTLWLIAYLVNRHRPTVMPRN